MSTAAWVTLIVIGAYVWGGFLLLLMIAMRKEHGKRHVESGEERGLWVP
ncbi:MAG: hypothetical protein ABR527_01225 [Gemmatimonadota bacterium]